MRKPMLVDLIILAQCQKAREKQSWGPDPVQGPCCEQAALA